MKSPISKSLSALAIAALSFIAFEKSAIAQCPPSLTFPAGNSLAADITIYPNGGGGDMSTSIPSTFLVDVPAGNEEIPMGLYQAWCVDEQTATTFPAVYGTVPGAPVTGTLYATCDPNLNSELPGHPNTHVSSTVWLEVDYILKLYNENPSAYFYWTVQAAINTLVGSASNTFNSYCNETLTTPLPDGCGGYPSYDDTQRMALVAAAQTAVAAGWFPTCRDYVGVIYQTDPSSQFILIEVLYTAPPTISAPGGNLGCSPTTLPTATSVQNSVKVTGGCCSTAPAIVAIVLSTTTFDCTTTQIWTITATDSCGDTIAPTTATYTWSIDTTPPVFTKLPTAGFEGCGLTNVPTSAQLNALIKSGGITATFPCSGVTNIMVTEGNDVTNDCTATRVYTIAAFDDCTNTTTNLTYSYTIQTNVTTKTITTNITCTFTVTTNCCTNIVCGNLNCQNLYGCQWVWLNSHINCTPGQPCTVYCKNASVTITCGSGKTYTYSCPDGQINFSSTCNAGTSSFDGTKWNTTLPCSGDSEIFLQGCSIPWNSDFANCKNVCWSGVFSCSNPQINCSFDWGNSCYNSKQPSCGSISPKPCYQTPCQNGDYNNDGNHAGCPENYQSSCISGNSGYGNWSGGGYNEKTKSGNTKDISGNWNDSGNWNCSWNTSPICCGNLITNCTYVTNYITNITTTTQCCSTTPPCVPKSICGNFNSQNPNGGWLWCNAHISCQPNTKCTVYCHNASITVACNDGNTYTYPVPDCEVDFSPNCNQASCSYSGSSWKTTVPTCGDDQIFLSGCGIPWKSEFANCHSVTWNGTFCCDTPGINCNWQWSSACYNYNLSNCSSVNVKPCHNLWCGYSNGDQCGTPESCKNYCWGGGCGGGGSNWTGSWSGNSSCW